MPASRTAVAEARRLPPIERLNALDRDGFARPLTRLLEHAPGLTDRLFAERPFRSYEHLLESARVTIAAMPEADRVAILAAHPRIGARGAMSAESTREQGAAASAGVGRALAELNDAYERRFGFRFVVFVAGRPKAAILEVLRARLARPRDEELRTGLAEYLAIAADRLHRLA